MQISSFMFGRPSASTSKSKNAKGTGAEDSPKASSVEKNNNGNKAEAQANKSEKPAKAAKTKETEGAPAPESSAKSEPVASRTASDRASTASNEQSLSLAPATPVAVKPAEPDHSVARAQALQVQAESQMNTLISGLKETSGTEVSLVKRQESDARLGAALKGYAQATAMTATAQAGYDAVV